MKIVTAAWVIVRLLALVVLSWLLVGLASPTPDPLVVGLGWLLVIGLVLAMPPSRRVVSRWISNGQLRRTAR
jgi:hypothetical protein